MLITLSGLDGAGKSTITRWLKTTLEARRRPAVVLHMHDDVGVYAVCRSLRDRLLGARRPRNDGPPAAGLGRARYALLWNKTLRQLIYPLDLVVFLGYRFYVERVRRRVLIMDRYFYDTLVDVWSGRRSAWFRLLTRLTPTPDVAVLLNVPPERAFDRKGERSLAYLQERWQAYRIVFPTHGASLIVSNHDLSAAQAAIERAVTACLPAA